MARLLPIGAALLATAALATGCAGAKEAGATVPESASLAPADAIAFATITTDADSEQWKQADEVLSRVPALRDGLTAAIANELGEQGLDWETDVAPALGPEVVVVGTANRHPIVLVQPESEERLDALLETVDEDLARADVDGHVALAEEQAHLAEYRTALARGTIEDDPKFVAGIEALPADSLGLVWVDLGAVTKALGSELEVFGVSEPLEVGLDWLSAALAADDDGLLVVLGSRTPGGGDTHYEPELFDRVPADSVVAVSFGGTQGVLDRIEGQVDVDGIAGALEKVTGVSLDGVLEALTGEGVLFVRPGEELPEVTLALRPPDADETWADVDRLIRGLADDAGATVTTSTENGVAVSRATAEGTTVRWARPEPGLVVVTTGTDVAVLSQGGETLAETDAFEAAAEAAGLGRAHEGLRVRRRRRAPARRRAGGRHGRAARPRAEPRRDRRRAPPGLGRRRHDPRQRVRPRAGLTASSTVPGCSSANPRSFSRPCGTTRPTPRPSATASSSARG